MNYQLIRSEKQLDKFIDFLKDTSEDERYYITLLARRKYDTSGTIKSDRSQIKRVLAKKELIKSKIRQMETALGTYEQDGNPVPQEALALYITPNPRSLKKAGLKLLAEIANKISRGESFNPSALSLNCVQVSSENARWFDLDIDLKPSFVYRIKVKEKEIFFSQVDSILGKGNYRTISTRGGWHILVDLHSETLDKRWYNKIQSLKTEEIDIMMNGKDALIPCAGCVQGNTSPRMYD